MTNSKRLTRTTMGSALERHTAGREALAVQETARELAAASVSASTRPTYEGALRRLQDWLDGRILDDATLAEYLAARFEAVHSPAVAGQVVVAVRFYAKLGGHSSPGREGVPSSATARRE